MKGCGKMILGMSAVTALLLFYVHGQVTLFRVSYVMDSQSKALAKKSEEYRRLKFEVDRLKAPLPLEEKMRKLSIDLTLPKEIKVLRVPPSSPVRAVAVEHLSTSPVPNGFLKFLGRWVDIAQAKTDR